MKSLRYFSLLFLGLSLLIILIPGLTTGTQDMIFLIAILLAYTLIFMYGAMRIVKALASSQSQFNARYFGTMGIRMLTGIILIVTYLKFSSVLNKFGTIFLICSYFVYMGFEIKIILSKLRTNSEKSKNTDDARK